MRHKLSLVFLILFLAILPVFAANSTLKVKVYPAGEVKGSGPLPYNYRVINNWLHVGGHPFNPANEFGNTDAQIRKILAYLKSKGVVTVIDLCDSKQVEGRYQKLLKEAGLKKYAVPMTADKLPTKKEWANIKSKIRTPVYIHCKWGADRSGAVLARYLVEDKGYFPEEAYGAVISGGSCAGALGGLKQAWAYRKLKKFIYEGVK
ncbi:MAG: hypothetical protein NT099_05555 [Candidatus Saganbacteria bacterium]|nr:hypothetical protein [Candidatus Saganbacteria bacterium]